MYPQPHPLGLEGGGGGPDTLPLPPSVAVKPWDWVWFTAKSLHTPTCSESGCQCLVPTRPFDALLIRSCGAPVGDLPLPSHHRVPKGATPAVWQSLFGDPAAPKPKEGFLVRSGMFGGGGGRNI